MAAIGLSLSILIGVSLGFFGGGGSILTVPLLVYVFGMSPKEAISSSLLIVGIASVLGAIDHARRGNVRVREGLWFGVASMFGAYSGGRLAVFLDEALLLLLFASMMFLTAIAMWRRGRREQTAFSQLRHGLDAEPRRFLLVVQGAAVGAFTGMVGAGGGFLIVPALVLWAGLPISQAVGTSLLVIVLKSVSGFLGYAQHVEIDPFTTIGVSTLAMVGSLVGSRLATRIDPQSLQQVFAAFVLLMGGIIMGREASTASSIFLPALPATGPQVAFALLLVVLGVAIGRSSVGAIKREVEPPLMQGAGI
jgi:uncharacterized membrane protein YfcA